MKKITFCIPSKNNLRYLKNSINSIKLNSEIEHDIIVFVDADNDGTENWLIENNITYTKNDSIIPKGISFGYNRCIELADTEIVCMFHADMYMGKGFDSAILKHTSPKKVISGTRIEPPLHPQGKEKIVMDFGMYPEDFKLQEFQEFVETTRKQNVDRTTQGIFAPWAVFKSDIIDIGLHDEEFHSYHEDSDIFNRFILNGYEIIQTWEGLVYHLTCRGGQFQDGIEKVTTDPAFHKMKTDCMRQYLRKWGCWIKNDEYQYPILSSKYNVAFVVQHCNEQALELLEPWCDRIYIDDEMQVITTHYIDKEQPNTKFDLSKRVLQASHNDPKAENDIVLEFDARKFTQESFDIIQQLSQIIKSSGEIGEFELDIFKITIQNLVSYEKDLIVCNTTY